MTIFPVAVRHEAADNEPILRLVDFETLVRILETGTLSFRRRLDRNGSAEEFLHRRLADDLIRLAAASGKPKGKLERWWAKQQQAHSLDQLIAEIRGFHLPELAWVDPWLVAGDGGAVAWEDFGDSGALIAIESTRSRLQAALQPADGQRISLEADEDRHLGVGRARRELRAVLTVEEPGAIADRTEVPVTVALQTLMVSLVLAPASSDDRRHVIARVLKRYGLTIPCRSGHEPSPAQPLLPIVADQA